MLDSAGRGGTMLEAAGTRMLSGWYSVCRTNLPRKMPCVFSTSASPRCAFNVKGSGSESASEEQRKTWASHWPASSKCSLSPTPPPCCSFPLTLAFASRPSKTRPCSPSLHPPSGRKHSSQPESHGWTKTGSNAQSRVEYYQRDNVRMDYYPTTGTVKTSMDHPTQGKTQMFRRDLSESSFQNVLDNPRSHTGHGYQRK